MNVTVTPDNLKEYPFHKHSVSEIVVYVEGEGEMQTENGNFAFKKGTVLIIPPNITHRSKSENGFKNICVHVSDQLLKCDNVLKGSDNAQGDAQTLAVMLMRAYMDAKRSGSLVSNLYGALKSLVLALTASPCDDRADALRDEISLKYSDAEFNVGRALSGKGLSEDHLRVVFKNKFGCTPIEYLKKVRLCYAKELFDVYGDSMRICEVAQASGYSDESYFSKAFKKYTGKSPKEYVRKSK